MVLDELGLGSVVILLLWYVDLVGDLYSGVIYGGVILVLMDICCGVVVMLYFDGVKVMVIIDLCIDYMCVVMLW